jgi:hypothetical protein
MGIIWRWNPSSLNSCLVANKVDSAAVLCPNSNCSEEAIYDKNEQRSSFPTRYEESLNLTTALSFLSDFKFRV